MEEKRKDKQKIQYLNNDGECPIQTIIKKEPYIIIPCFTKKEYYINESEYRLYKTLEQIYKNSNIKISTQVAINQILNINERREIKNKEFNEKISKKSIDFVLFNLETRQILCCIELNGTSHHLEKRKKRDEYINEIFKTSKIPLIFIENKNFFKQDEIKKMIDQAIEQKS